MKIPWLRIEAVHTVKGKILVMPITGHGDALLEPGEWSTLCPDLSAHITREFPDCLLILGFLDTNKRHKATNL
jgi:hypothetical protein